jgi:hypothetical protein
MPTVPPKLLARATSRLGTPSLVPSSMAPSMPSLLPFTFGSEVCLFSGGGTTHPFCVGGQTPPPCKRSQRKHCPCHAGRLHGALDPQEHLLCGRRHIGPALPINTQSTLNGWALSGGGGIHQLKQLGDSVASCSFGGTWEIMLLFLVLLEALFGRQFSWRKFTSFCLPFLVFWLIVGLNIAVLLHPVPRVVPLGLSLHPSFYTSILAPQYESVSG